jgi:site-specific DNA-cytosine methylase
MVGDAEAFYIPEVRTFALQGSGQTSQGSNGDGWNEEVSFTLNQIDIHGVVQPISYDMKQHHNPQPSNTVQLTTKNCSMVRGDTPLIQPIDFSAQMSVPQTDVDMTSTLQAKNPMAVAVGVDTYNGTENGQVSCTITADVGGPTHSGPKVMQAMAVRRLTPRECERLQGFRDDYTDIMPRGKATPDGPRYRALGNSMAVPVMAWIGKRIQEVENIK